MANIDAFLKNKNLFERNTSEIEILPGLPVKLGSLNYDEFKKVLENSKNGATYQEMDELAYQLETVMYGLVDPTAKELQKMDASYKTPKDAVAKTFNAEQISKLAMEITKLSDFGGDNVTEIKND